jgi:galactose mutarotase-like enzyme
LNITIIKSGLTATISPKGAQLISLKSNATNTEYIWEGNPDFWGKHSPVLFPIVGTLKEGSYFYNNKNFELSRHGFARDYDFELIHANESEAVFSLKANEATLKVYPFHFEFQIAYTLDEKKLTVAYTVINNENVTLPFSIGAHPAFALPGKFEDYSLAFEHQENLVSYELENDLLSDKTVSIAMNANILPLSYSLFEKDALIFKEMKSKKISILKNKVPLLNFSFEGFPNFGIWTKINAPFVCLEPWFGYSDTLNASRNIIEKEAIQFLDPGNTFECHFSMEIL